MNDLCPECAYATSWDAIAGKCSACGFELEGEDKKLHDANVELARIWSAEYKRETRRIRSLRDYDPAYEIPSPADKAADGILTERNLGTIAIASILGL
jgi:hypothetical protein